MPDDLKKTAIVYDFDGTLARGNLQECSFIPKMNLTREEFWDEVKTRTRTEDADEILVYMHLMLEKAKETGVEVTKQMLREHGEHANLFNGLKDLQWFARINAFAAQYGRIKDAVTVSCPMDAASRNTSPSCCSMIFVLIEPPIVEPSAGHFAGLPAFSRSYLWSVVGWKLSTS